MQTTVEKHLAAINAGLVTKTNVIGLRKLINGMERMQHGWSVSPALARSVDEFCALNVEEILELRKPLVGGELKDSGIALLQSKRYRKRLERVQPSIRHIWSFQLIWFDRIGQRGEYAVPVYRCNFAAWDDRDGFFDFRNIPWQSGGKGPEIWNNRFGGWE